MGFTGLNLKGWWTEPFRKNKKKAERKVRKVKRQPSFTVPRSVYGRTRQGVLRTGLPRPGVVRQGLSRRGSDTWSPHTLTNYGHHHHYHHIPPLDMRGRGRFLQGLNNKVADRLDLQEIKEWTQWLRTHREGLSRVNVIQDLVFMF